MHPELAGYWQSFDLPGEETLPIANTPQQYTDIIIAFAAPDGEGILRFTGPNVPTRREILYLQQRGQHVLLSIGGGGITVTLDTGNKVARFSESLYRLVRTLGVDGIDINVEQGMFVTGSPYQPTGTALGLIEGLDNVLKLLAPEFILTMAPQTKNLVGGISRYGGEWGNYLPLILYFGNRITKVHMQYYNSVPMIGLNGQIYQIGTIDFVIAMTEAIIQGFPIADTGVYFNGLPSYKVSIGLPATPQAASNGYMTPMQVGEIYIKLLSGWRGVNRAYATAYPRMGGLMTWSIQWDSLNNYNFMRSGTNILQIMR